MFHPLNLIDLAIVLFIGYSLFDGWRRGILALIADLVALALSILIALQSYPKLAPLVSQWLKVPEQGGKVLAFFLLAFIMGTIFSYLFNLALKLIPPFIRGSIPDKVSGAAFGIVKGLVYLGIVLLLFSSLPVLQPVKDQVAGSRYAPAIIERTKVLSGRVEGYLKSQFGGLLEDTFALLTIKPGEKGLDLGFTLSKFRVDEKAEEAMLRLVNEERTRRGLVALKMDAKVREVARSHSEDMFRRGYFAHESPEGITPSERLDRAGIHYQVMGENLALAPDVELAHKGLMESPSHRENILFLEYRKIGIGAINGGFYGIMFSQEFTD